MADLRDAIAAVTVLQVADYLGMEGLQVGKNKSPFREVKSGEPFSIFKQGFAFKDHGNDEHRGNSWNFLELARPNLSKGDRAKIIFELAGMDPGSDDYSKTRFRDMQRAKRKAAYKLRDSEFLKLKEFDEPQEWTDTVADRWQDGAGCVPIKRLAESRGWPEPWVEWLVDLGKVSFPWMPWGDPTFKKARRGLAFKVEAPWFTTGVWAGIKQCGYHQRWIHEQDGQRRKDWLFVPNIPHGKMSTDFQRALHREQNRVIPFPFLLNELVSPRNIIITEGQWDAITINGAAGWFSDSAEINTQVVGLRGAQSVEVFLAFYGRWLRKIKPNVLLLPDNDAAGRKWIEREQSNKIIPTPTFAERLQAWGAKRVVHRSIDPKYGKDFNDYYQARRPEAAAIMDWLVSCGLEF